MRISNPAGSTPEMPRWLLLGMILLLVASSCQPGLSTAPAGTEPAAEPTEAVETVDLNQTPDLIFYNADILTMDLSQPAASAIAIAGDTILAVGGDAEILELADSGQTEVVDLQGLTITPGFIDSHSHRITQRGNWCLESVGEASQEALSLGWTGLDELYVNQGQLNEMIAADAADELHIRVNTYLAVNDDGQVYVSGGGPGWYQSYQPHQEFSPYLRIAGLKVFLDTNAGQDLLWTADDLNDLVYQRQLENWPIALRAMSTESHNLALDAIEYAFNQDSTTDHRYRFEHSMLSNQAIVGRMEDLGIVPSIQPDWPAVIWHASVVSDYLRNDDDVVVVGGGEEVAFRWREYIDSPELTVIASSCNPTSCAYEAGSEGLECYAYSNISPMGLIYHNVTQVGLAGTPPEPWMKSRSALTVEELLPLLTINSAYAIFQEQRLGSLSPGKLADLVVFSANPLDVDVANNPEALLDIRVLMTMVGGNVEYCGDPDGVACLDADGADDFSAARGSWVAEDSVDHSPMTLEVTEGQYNSFSILWIDRAASACDGNCFRGIGSGTASGYSLDLPNFSTFCPATDAEFEVAATSLVYDPDSDTITMRMDFHYNDQVIPLNIVWVRE
jgi:predicted amidohydrolase YtcJ